jgi:hypothetical protein
MVEQMLVKEVKRLIDEAWTLSANALEQKDYKTAEFFKNEAFELIAKLPENQQYLKNLQ